MKRTPIFDSFLGCVAFAGMAAVFFFESDAFMISKFLIVLIGLIICIMYVKAELKRPPHLIESLLYFPLIYLSVYSVLVAIILGVDCVFREI